MATVNPCPGFCFGYQAFDANGNPLNGGLINTYAAGGTTPTATYTTSAGNVTNANPIVLGADGRPPYEIWLIAGTSYRFDLTDSLGNLIKTYDNIPTTAGTVTSVASSAGLTGGTITTTGTLAIDYTSLGTWTNGLKVGAGASAPLHSTGDLYLTSSSGGVGFVATVGFAPTVDNTYVLGGSALRWTTVYATTGTINTSDAREKTAVEPLTPAELRASKRLVDEIGLFQLLEAIDKKGSKARFHIGMTVQRAIQILESEGLDPFKYGMICHDISDPMNPEAAFDRYSFRFDELLLFMVRGISDRIGRIEALLNI